MSEKQTGWVVSLDWGYDGSKPLLVFPSKEAAESWVGMTGAELKGGKQFTINTGEKETSLDEGDEFRIDPVAMEGFNGVVSSVPEPVPDLGRFLYRLQELEDKVANMNPAIGLTGAQGPMGPAGICTCEDRVRTLERLYKGLVDKQ